MRIDRGDARRSPPESLPLRQPLARGGRRPAQNFPPSCRHDPMNPRSEVLKRPMFGKTSGRSDRSRRTTTPAWRRTARPTPSGSSGRECRCRSGRPVAAPGRRFHSARRRRRSRRRARRRRRRSGDCPTRDRCRPCRARSGRLQRATEVRQRERRDLLLESELDGGVVERLDRLTHLREQAGLRRRADPGACRSRRADRRRSADSGRAPATSTLNLMTFATCFSWLPERRVRKRGGQRHVAVQDLPDVDRLLRRPARGLRPAP